MKDYVRIAKSMLDLDNKDDLPPSLSEILNGVNSLCEKYGTELISRQVIATIIYNWKTK
jgi:hypothetical protein